MRWLSVLFSKHLRLMVWFLFVNFTFIFSLSPFFLSFSRSRSLSFPSFFFFGVSQFLRFSFSKPAANLYKKHIVPMVSMYIDFYVRVFVRVYTSPSTVKEAPGSKTKQNKTKQNKTKQNKTKQNKTKQDKTKQNKTDCTSLN